MSRLTVYRNPTRVVVPLRSSESFPVPTEALNPVLEVDGKTVVTDNAALAALPSNALRTEVANLRRQRLEIVNALDFLFRGD